MVKVGDEIKEEDSLITVESDKASMDIPSPESGLVKSIDIKVGDVVKEGSLILSIEPLASDTPNESKKEPPKQDTKKTQVESASESKLPNHHSTLQAIGTDEFSGFPHWNLAIFRISRAPSTLAAARRL